MQKRFFKSHDLPFTERIDFDAKDNLLIVDSKVDLPPAVNQMLERGANSISVDTVEPWAYNTDFAVFPSFFVSSHVSSFFSEQTKVFAGREYVILRSSSPKRKSRPILVTFGGSDPNDLTTSVLQNLTRKGLGDKTSALIGPGFHKQSKWFSEHFPNVELIEAQESTLELIGSAQYVISALGVTLQEVEYYAKPCLVIFNYPHDEFDFDCLVRASGQSENWVNGGYFHELTHAELDLRIDDLLLRTPSAPDKSGWGDGWPKLLANIGL